jgi:hypothetical protein
VELALFGAFAALASRHLPLLVPRLAVALLYVTVSRRLQSQPFGFRPFLFYYVDAFYVEWIPLLFLLDLAAGRPAFWALFALHLVVFPKNAARRISRELPLRRG